ncbi:uncharacterized protein LOC127451722 isoform X2 [Myxocyprinus asiaticus]|uniref:uncharacterized protein LOC127451722 isoform X2 n=1 Tax=Myxocyprinus asiaticus TaxID=70543 RepID=UPI0022219179|nr:uncharacterized protein LOC127451722 isoform X2 [Myxocyprinus asiaticus]
MGLTEKMVENLFPTVKQPNTFLKELEHDVETSSGLQIQLTQQRSSETWPAVFSLPAFPQQIHEALQRKDPSLKKKGKSRLRSLLIQVLFDNITKHTWYPNHTIYADVLGSLITKFPFLKDCSASGHDTLLQCLRNKFKKERISLVRSSTIQELGVKRNLMDHTSSDGLGFEEEHAKRRKTTHPIYTQENLENMGEDETSFQEHISAINTELRRGQPDYTEIKNHMRQTLFKRLELMEKPTKEVMDMFPFLGVPQLIWKRMQHYSFCHHYSKKTPSFSSAKKMNQQGQPQQ